MEQDTPPALVVTVVDQTLIDDLALKLVIERISKDDKQNKIFESVEAGVNIGDKVRVKLQSSNPDSFRCVIFMTLSINFFFSFSLHECEVHSGGENFVIFNEYCVNPKYPFFNVKVVNLTNFDITVFQVANSKDVSFDCNVRMHLLAKVPALPNAKTCTFPTNALALTTSVTIPPTGREKRNVDTPSKTNYPETIAGTFIN